MTVKKKYYCESCKAFHASRNTVKAHAKAIDGKNDTSINSVNDTISASITAIDTVSIEASNRVSKIDLKPEYDSMDDKINPKPEEKKAEKEAKYQCARCGKLFYDEDRSAYCSKCGAEF